MANPKPANLINQGSNFTEKDQLVDCLDPELISPTRRRISQIQLEIPEQFNYESESPSKVTFEENQIPQTMDAPMGNWSHHIRSTIKQTFIVNLSHILSTPGRLKEFNDLHNQQTSIMPDKDKLVEIAQIIKKLEVIMKKTCDTQTGITELGKQTDTSDLGKQTDTSGSGKVNGELFFENKKSD